MTLKFCQGKVSEVRGLRKFNATLLSMTEGNQRIRLWTGNGILFSAWQFQVEYWEMEKADIITNPQVFVWNITIILVCKKKSKYWSEKFHITLLFYVIGEIELLRYKISAVSTNSNPRGKESSSSSFKLKDWHLNVHLLSFFFFFIWIFEIWIAWNLDIDNRF